MCPTGIHCDTCKNEIIITDWEETCVGYGGFPIECDHDDNCMSIRFECSCNLYSYVLRRKCPNDNCDWQGREKCFCHKNEKTHIDNLPNGLGKFIMDSWKRNHQRDVEYRRKYGYL